MALFAEVSEAAATKSLLRSIYGAPLDALDKIEAAPISAHIAAAGLAVEAGLRVVPQAIVLSRAPHLTVIEAAALLKKTPVVRHVLASLQ